MVSDLPPLLLLKVADESNPIKENPAKELPPCPSTNKEELIGGEVELSIEAEDEAGTRKSISIVSESPKQTIGEQLDLGNDYCSAAAVHSCKTQGGQPSNSDTQDTKSVTLNGSPAIIGSGSESCGQTESSFTAVLTSRASVKPK